MLLNATLAVSARHLSFLGRTDICDLSDFVHYQEQCLNHFIPSLNDSSVILDENILAATVTLRYLEEVDGRNNQYSHTLSSSGSAKNCCNIPLPHSLALF